MAVFWVQHYYTLPIIFEDFGMGDEPQLRQNLISQDSDEQLSRGLCRPNIVIRIADYFRTIASFTTWF